MSALRETVKRWLPPVMIDLLRKSPKRGRSPEALQLNDAHLYQPLFSPWLGLEPFAGIYNTASKISLVSADRCWVLYTLAQQAMTLPGNGCLPGRDCRTLPGGDHPFRDQQVPAFVRHL